MKPVPVSHIDYKNAFGSPSGQLVLEDLKRAHFIESSTASFPVDPYRIAFNEGQRNVILRIMSIIESKEEDYGRDNRNSDLGKHNGRSAKHHGDRWVNTDAS